MAVAVVDTVVRQILAADPGKATVDSVARQILWSQIGVAAVSTVTRLVLVSTSQELAETAASGDSYTVSANYTAILAEPATADDQYFITSVRVDGVTSETLLANTNPPLTVDGIASETLLAEPCITSVAGITVETLLRSTLHPIMHDEVPPVAGDMFAIVGATSAPKPAPPPQPIKSTTIPSATAQQPYPPVPTSMDSWYGWNQQLARTINLTLAGKTNNTLASFTFKANSPTTTLYMTQIGANSVISLTPLTANAAAEKWHVSSQKQGEAVITHTNSATTDRTYSVMVVG